jgi:hypothetical protein
MGRRRIFVSHSNSDPDADVGFDVLVDRKRLESRVRSGVTILREAHIEIQQIEGKPGAL